MSFVGAAIVGAGALGAGASIYSANKSAGAINDASRNATNAQLSMFGQAKDALQPFISGGSDALSQLKALLSGGDGTTLGTLQKLLTPGPNQTATLSQLPGLQFAQDWGQKGITAQSTASRGLGGNAMAEGAKFATGTAQQGFGGLVQQLLQLFGGQTGALQNLVSTGAGAAGSLAGNSTQVGSNVGNNMLTGGMAQGGAAIAGGNALSGLAGSAGNLALLNSLTGGQLLGGGGMYGNSANGTVPIGTTGG